MADQRGIRTEHLNIGYRDDLIRDICLEVRPGRIVTLIGPNGSGKSTLLKTLTGELKARGGAVFLDGTDRSSIAEAEAARRMAMVMTYRVWSEYMTCREAVETGRYPYTGRFGILSERDRQIVREAMEWTDVAGIGDAYVRDISDGQRQRVMLARAICQQPEVLVLDEPTSYLDIRHKLDILQKIRSLAAEKNIAVLMSLHELMPAMRISDTVVALGEGRVLKTGSPGEVFREDFIRKLYNIEHTDTELLGNRPWYEEKDPGGADSPQTTAPQEAAEAAAGRTDGTGMPAPQEECRDGSEIRAEAGAEALRRTPAEGKGRARVIMIQGTMSNAGKSLIAAGLCRIFAQDGFRTAPFKSQNMALNSCVTPEGLEMGRAQVMQSECAGIEPMVCMNPILLKPTSDVGSQVIVNGQVVGNMKAGEYFRRKKEFVKDIRKAYEKLSGMADIIVVEGAGSPAEMNLKRDDIVNMGLAEMIDAPVLLVGDIDRGGVFAQLIGTVDLLEKEERDRVKGFIVNKFRGDPALFEDGIRILEEKGRTRVVGVVPWMDVKLDDEDSLSDRFGRVSPKAFDIAVVRLRHISNYTDFDTFEQIRDVSVRYVSAPEELGDPDMIVLPGSKNTIGDLRRLKESGLAGAIAQKAEEGTVLFGICGGYQMLGRIVEDPEDSECGGRETGLCLLPVDTRIGREKVRTVYSGRIPGATGVLADLRGAAVEGYEIHMGETVPYEELTEFTSGGTGYCRDNIYGSYVHGLFDRKEIMTRVIRSISARKGVDVDVSGAADYASFRQTQYDILADRLRESLDMEYIYRILGIDRTSRGPMF